MTTGFCIFRIARLCFTSTALAAVTLAQAQWPMGGGNIYNNRTSTDTKLNRSNVGQLAVKWVFTTNGDVSATPVVSEGNVFAVDWGFLLGGPTSASIHSVSAATGVANWSKSITSLTGNPRGSMSRTSPAVHGSNLIIGDQGDLNPNDGSAVGFFPTSWAYGEDTAGRTASVMAVDKTDGHLVWRTIVDNHPWSMVTASPVVHNGVAYVGICSFEEAADFFGPTPFPPSFRGSLVALDAATGVILWKTYMAPPGYAGCAIWGSTPAVDPASNTVYVATGNNYAVPASVAAQIAADPANGVNYLAADDFVDAVVAVDMTTGGIKWGRRLQGADTWTTGQVPNPQTGPDYDFGSGPNLFKVNGKLRVGAGQKSGVYWQLKPDTGAVLWGTQVGPGGLSGGIQWGSACDGDRIYCGVTNADNKPYQIGGTTYTGGSFAALDADNGKVKWQIPDPNNGKPYGMVTASNGIMFASSTSGHMYAIDTTKGTILWSYLPPAPYNFLGPPGSHDGSTVCGPAVVDGVVYWGTGYSRFFSAFGGGGFNNKLYAFALP